MQIHEDPFTTFQLVKESVIECRRLQGAAMLGKNDRELALLLDHEHRLLDLLLTTEPARLKGLTLDDISRTVKEAVAEKQQLKGSVAISVKDPGEP